MSVFSEIIMDILNSKREIGDDLRFHVRILRHRLEANPDINMNTALPAINYPRGFQFRCPLKVPIFVGMHVKSCKKEQSFRNDSCLDKPWN